MLQSIRRRWLLVTVSLLVIVGLAILTVYFGAARILHHKEASLPPKQEAPPDLQKLRNAFASGVQALQRGDGADAVRHFTSFDFGPRAVEEYRLYYLANAYQLTGDRAAARMTLARLWRRSPRMIYTNDVGFNLATLYAESGDVAQSAAVHAALARRADIPDVAANARWNAAMKRLYAGDIAGALYSARSIVIRHPRSPQAAHAIALARAISGVPEEQPLPLTPAERLERAVSLVAANDPKSAADELEALRPVAPAQLRPSVELQLGIALRRMRKFEQSNETLEPLTSGPYRYAFPALRALAKNYATLAASIDPKVIKTVKEKKRVGTVKVRVGKGKKRRTVRRPKYQTVFRKVELVDLEKKKKRDEYDRLATERLKDLLSLPIDDALRLETLNSLLARAMEKNQDDYVRELVPQVIKLNPIADPALQHFWDKAWAAYEKGDLATAESLLRFIADTYTHPNIRRQSEYWYARTVERQGKKEEAAAIYRKLADAPYTDLYAVHAANRGAKHEPAKTNPLAKESPDWSEIADREMPRELRLAYELTALSAMREAYLEIRRNMRTENARYAEALLADVHHAAGNDVLKYRSLRRAWPQLATVEQDSVPNYFIRLYYPTAYGEEIDEYSKKNDLDPALVRALILQESYYNPEAKSPVGATGLMQLMPPTAKEHARKLRIPFAVSRLEDPEVNIRLGTFHLRMLLNLFKGNPYFAVASYNAGQGNVAKWRRQAPSRPLDEFLEDIPFQETRNYVKRVTMLRSAYARLMS